MTKIIVDSHYDVGGYRDVYEDRVRTQVVATAGGLSLSVSAVADGVGGENKGERAAQTAIDAFFTVLERSRETDIPALLTQAVQYANKSVYQLQQETGGASTTLTAAVITGENRLFIANVGDSRVYLMRNQKLTQLTIDHSFANVAPWGGKISAEAASSHPRASALMRAIGPKPDVEVDLGFYVGTTDFDEANARGQSGLPLQEGDAILVCSDGLIKDNPQGQLLITEPEIIRTLHDKEGKTAAKELVSFALGRGPDDNISAAVMQMPDPGRVWRARRGILAITGASLLIICILVAGLVSLRGRVVDADVTTTAVSLALNSTGTEQARRDEAVAATQTTIAKFTPTHTNTPTPTLPPFEPGQVGIILTEGAPSFKINESLPAPNSSLQLNVYHTDGFSPPGYVFASSGSLLRFDTVEDQFFQFSITQSSQVFVETGNYVRAVIKPANVASLTLILDGACIAVDDTLPDTLLTSCYEGACTYDVLGGINGSIPQGQELLLDTTSLTVLTVQMIPEAEAKAWKAVLPGGSAASNCANQYIPTPTPTPRPQPTSTKILPTSKPGEPTNTPVPTVPPTNTPVPTVPPTNTPVPTVPPTNTPVPTVPPTNTPVPTVPPTNTPVPTVPPTNTPVPTPTCNPRTQDC